MATSLLDAITHAIDKEKNDLALRIGHGEIGAEMREQKIGIVKGLKRALELVKETAVKVNKEDQG